MARIHPHGWQALASDANGASLALQRELDTLRQLAEVLPDEVTVYHGVHWTHLAGPHTVIDDIDFVVIGPQGQIVLIEQVAGFLSESPAGLIRKRPGNDPASTLASTLAHTVATLGGRLRRAFGEGGEKTVTPRIEVLLYCPDYTVRSQGTAGLPPERIVDASRREILPAVLLELLGLGGEKAHPSVVAGEFGVFGDRGGAGNSTGSPTAPPATQQTAASPAPIASAAASAEKLARLHRFFADLLQLTPETSAIVGEAAGLTTRLSGGLASWARRLHFSPHRLRVIGTAGSGKTQLALAALRDAEAAGRRALYVCYNRPLADHMTRLLGAQGLGHNSEAGTYHQLCDRIARQLGRAPEFTQADAFRQLEALLADVPESDLAAWKFDELIVDEGQDFTPEWATALFRLLKQNARVWWLEDPRQNLYGRPPVTLPDPADWVELRCENNYRTPRAILDSIHAMLGEPASLRPAGSDIGSPIVGQPPEILSYRDEAGLIEQTKRAIGLGIAAGFKRSMIAVLSYRGRETSLLSPLEKLGPYTLRTFSGSYDLLGNPIYRDGDITLDSIMRFKGQAAPCVVLSEIAFETLDEKAQRRLFVGATRATLALFLVAHEDSAKLLRERAGMA